MGGGIGEKWEMDSKKWWEAGGGPKNRWEVETWFPIPSGKHSFIASMAA